MAKTIKAKPDASAVRTRRCLLCGESFLSEGPHNRICRRCKGTQAWRQG